jgi:sulfite reductase (NADPH) flavoprotein alpha-component
MNHLLPENAPFTEEQRAWLNGFFAGLIGLQAGAQTNQSGQINSALAGLNALQGDSTGSPSLQENEESFPWHDSSLPIDQRMELAKEKPIERRLMAAMAQLDCGSCGYLCQTYAEAIASGQEKNLTLCSPGGKETKQMVKLILKDGVNGNHAPAPTNGASKSTSAKVEQSPIYSRQNPFPARLVESRTLNKLGSDKDVRHVVLDLAGSNLSYEVGDALGVCPVNCQELVEAVIQALSADKLLRVTAPSGEQMSLYDALSYECCLRDPSDEMIELLSERLAAGSAKQKLKDFQTNGVPLGVDVLDILRTAQRAEVSATELIESLQPLNPRLYSIASSMKQVGQTVHLTVGKVTYERDSRLRKGVASHMLAERLPIGTTVRVFVQKNHGGFTIPADDTLPMIMVGPGTGIAPFLAFLQERAARSAPGKNWLFFGDQHQATDFLYQEELDNWRKNGLLTRLDTAFSRDTGAKVYVQNRMMENPLELWNWLEQGGYFYVCGDAKRMAVDVERALLSIISKHGTMDENRAQQYLDSMRKSGRYSRDVY